VFVEYHRSVLTLLTWQWRAVLTYVGLATLIVVAHEHLGKTWLAVPALPLTVLGAAIGIFVSFRTNSCYDRWWEGRRLWGQLVNTSRHFASQVLEYAEPLGPEIRALQSAMVRRHIAYVHTLRCTLRDEEPTRDTDVPRYLDTTEFATLADEPNPNHALVHLQIRDIAQLARLGAVDGLRLQQLDRSIAVLLDVQGGCERIKKTPFPQSYGFVATKLIGAYILMLPLGLVDRVQWLAIPISVLVCLAFRLIDEVGDVLEDPFTAQPMALPLQAISTGIEIDLCKRLGVEPLPEPPKPDSRGVLM